MVLLQMIHLSFKAQQNVIDIDLIQILKVVTAREKLSLQYNNDRKRNSELAVVTPAFVSDCLETLEEIAMEASHEFKTKLLKQWNTTTT